MALQKQCQPELTWEAGEAQARISTKSWLWWVLLSQEQRVRGDGCRAVLPAGSGSRHTGTFF